MIPSTDELKEQIKLDKLQGRALGEATGLFGGLGREFREFVARGNAVDLAVGVSIGTAFSNLIQSFVQNIISPPMRMAMSAIRGAASSAQSNVAGATGFDWSPPQNGPGAFLGQLGTFAMLAFSTFIVVKLVNRFKGALEKRALEKPADAAPDIAHEDPQTRVIAQNDRIIHLLEQLNTRPNAITEKPEATS
ncbi:MscL family protein [bacterium]|nr:MAG: MscL family protein [bacterium]